jgi:hypothetical protein
MNPKQKIKIKRMITKLKKNNAYGSRDEIENKLKFDKKVKNQN